MADSGYKRATGSGRLHSARLSFFISLLAFSVSLVGCTDSRDHTEASAIARTVDALRLAPSQDKRALLERLLSLPCSAADVCAARDACALAFTHHVRGLELTTELKARMQGPANSPAPSNSAAEALAGGLLEASLELDQGRELMPSCDNQVSALRLRRRL